MRAIGVMTLVGLLVLLIASCSTTPEMDIPIIEGPALVLFYTDD